MDGVGRVIRQLLVAVALAAFVVACLRLGWWQWQRYHSVSGTLQNLGYTLQWPTFALFAIIAWWRLRRLERQRREQGPPAPPPAPPPPLVIPDVSDGDDELAAYNRYLAQLHAQQHAEEQQRGQ